MAGKGDKDTRTPDFRARRKNHDKIFKRKEVCFACNEPLKGLDPVGNDGLCVACGKVWAQCLERVCAVGNTEEAKK